PAHSPPRAGGLHPSPRVFMHGREVMPRFPLTPWIHVSILCTSNNSQPPIPAPGRSGAGRPQSGEETNGKGVHLFRDSGENPAFPLVDGDGRQPNPPPRGGPRPPRGEPDSGAGSGQAAGGLDRGEAGAFGPAPGRDE